MRAVLFGFVLMCASVTSVAAFHMDPISDFVGPPRHLSRWIGLKWAGITTAPISSMYYGTEFGKPRRYQADGYAVLDRAEYKHLSEFVHSYNCSNDPVNAKPPYPNTIEVGEFAHRREQVLCFLPREKSCDFLSRLSALRDTERKKRENQVLWILWSAIGCSKDTNPFPGDPRD